jgi:aspartate/methionine/tyrosine aminotransferase
MISQRVKQLKPFLVMDILEKAQFLEARGEQIIHLEIGEPDFETPIQVKEAASHALQACGKTHYSPSLGLLELRKTLVKHYRKKYGVKFEESQILVTSGTSPAMLLAFSAILNPGDEVIITNPYYPCYPNFVRYLDAQPVFLKLNEENSFKFSAEQVKELLTPRTKAIVINSPANPTGTVISTKTLQKLAQLGPTLISDEIYHELAYEARARSALEFTSNTIVINGFSKAYAMTGWRLGFLIAPPPLMRLLQILQQNFLICAPTLAQHAALKVFEPSVQKELYERVAIYKKRRKFLLDQLEKIGLRPNYQPEGAFYILVKVKKYFPDSYRFSLELLEKARVAVTPGIDFGTEAEGYIRLSYANSLENIKEGIERLGYFLKEKQL